MTKLDLEYVQRFTDRHGKTRHYFRRAGFNRTPLPGKVGSAEFMAAYDEALKAPKRTAVLGHQSLWEVQRYTRDADQVRLADQAMTKLQTV